jgi:DNA-binding beta-propeller fold protein YncE
MGKNGHVPQIIGSGKRGLADGSFAEAMFALPEGMAVVNGGRSLIVADQANHALRRVDFEAGTVTTIAGTGERGTDAPMMPLPAQNVSLASPWDLELVGDTLWIAMAGMHQLWTLDLATNSLQLAAGTGAESIHDGSLLEATFAQPSGIAALGHVLFTADSESSSVRRVDPVEDRVRRLVGRGLFEFGDRDGAGDEVRLQHDIGIASDPVSGALYIADSYNHRIKRLDPETRTVTTVAGSGNFGFDDGDLLSAKFWEPSGLAVDGQRLYVADTNNHAIRLVDLGTKQVTTLDVR